MRRVTGTSPSAVSARTTCRRQAAASPGRTTVTLPGPSITQGHVRVVCSDQCGSTFVGTDDPMVCVIRGPGPSVNRWRPGDASAWRRHLVRYRCRGRSPSHTNHSPCTGRKQAKTLKPRQTSIRHAIWYNSGCGSSLAGNGSRGSAVRQPRSTPALTDWKPYRLGAGIHGGRRRTLHETALQENWSRRCGSVRSTDGARTSALSAATSAPPRSRQFVAGSDGCTAWPDSRGGGLAGVYERPRAMTHSHNQLASTPMSRRVVRASNRWSRTTSTHAGACRLSAADDVRYVSLRLDPTSPVLDSRSWWTTRKFGGPRCTARIAIPIRRPQQAPGGEQLRAPAACGPSLGDDGCAEHRPLRRTPALDLDRT